MILRPEQIALLALGLPSVPANFGGGDSSSSSSSATNNIDRRAAVAEGAFSASGDGSVINFTDNTRFVDPGLLDATSRIARDFLGILGQQTDLNATGSRINADAFNRLVTETGRSREDYIRAAQADNRLFRDALADITSDSIDAQRRLTGDAIANAERLASQSIDAQGEIARDAIVYNDRANVRAIDAVTGMARELSDVVARQTFGFLDDVSAASERNTRLVAQAYEGVQEISSGQRMMVAGGLVIAGIVAVAAFAKRS